MKRVFFEAALIIIAAAAIAMVVNGLRPKGIRVFGNQTPDALPAVVEVNVPRIDFKTAIKIVEEEDALFVDARPAEAFERGHIRGAVNLPLKSFDDMIFPFIEQTDLERRLITYCDGGTCTLGEELADLLYLSGFSHVSALTDGPQDVDPAMIVTGGDE